MVLHFNFAIVMALGTVGLCSNDSNHRIFLHTFAFNSPHLKWPNASLTNYLTEAFVQQVYSAVTSNFQTINTHFGMIYSWLIKISNMRIWITMSAWKNK